MQGKRLGATLRVDLPGLDSDSGLQRFSRTVRDYLEADHDADGTLLVLFSDEGWVGRTGPASRVVPAGAPVPGTLGSLLAALEVELESSGRPVRDAWYVGEAFWRNAYCLDPSCCPFPGRSVDEIRDSRLNAEMVFRGSSVGEDPACAAGCPARDVAADLSVMDAEQRWAGEFAARRGSRSQFATILDAWERVLAADAGARPSGRAGRVSAGFPVHPPLAGRGAGDECGRPAGRGAGSRGLRDVRSRRRPARSPAAA